MNKLGKKTKLWNKIRAELKIEFENLGITRCEKCGSNFGLSFAHRMKRRKITTTEELRTVALLCIEPCHRTVEQLPAQEMFDAVTEIITRRDNRVED